MDLIYAGVVAAFFTATWLLIKLCRKVGGDA